MSNNQLGAKKLDNLGAAIAQRTRVDGSINIIAPFVKTLSSSINGLNLRDEIRKEKSIIVADIAHYLCVAHGKHPGIIEHAMSKIIDDCSREWLVKAADGFTRERIYLAELTVAAGPITRIIGQDETDMLIVNQSKHYKMLASSDRKGCPIGAAAAFIIDWYHIRQLMDIMALTLNITIPSNSLPTDDETAMMINKYAISDNITRAVNFGADQILSQQRAFWNLIKARSTSRNIG